MSKTLAYELHLHAMGSSLEYLINATPSGEIRNLLIEMNIKLFELQAKLSLSKET
jgi:hypothetical protein